jgi:hypothetical protein
MTAETKFVAEVKALLAKGKVSAKTMAEVGKACGLTCRAVVDAKKLHFASETAPVTKAVKPAKAAKAAKPVKAPKAPKAAKEPVAAAPVEPAEGEVFVWIASPEEIENPTNLHEPDYIIGGEHPES